MAMLHKSETMGGMAHMSDESAIDVPAKGTLSFAPGGYHVMCMSPSAAVKPGGTVTMTLRFGDGTSLTAPFAVRNASGR
jgi:copper(I)-binding protein